MNWQKWARLLIAACAIAFAIAVAMRIRPRVAPAVQRVTTSDPKAVVESAGGFSHRDTRDHEDFSIKYQRQVTYTDGSSKMEGVAIDTDRAGGRHFQITANEAGLSKDQADFTFSGHVQIAVSDGMLIRTEHASYKESDATARASGPVDISRGRMTGSSQGFTYDKRLWDPLESTCRHASLSIL